MTWEQAGKMAYQAGLALVEWGLKICALVAGMMTLATKGSLGMRITAGFGSLSHGLRRLFDAPELIGRISWTAREYNRIGRTRFQEAYGLAPVDRLMAAVNDFCSFTHQMSRNLFQHPLISLVAVLLVFGSYYLLGRVIQFARQRGRQSWLCRLEQRLGDRVFNRTLPSRKSYPGRAKQQDSIERSMGTSPKLT